MTETGLMAVVVIFERDLGDVKPWRWLVASLEVQDSNLPGLHHVLVYDNSERARVCAAAAHDGCTYLHDPENGGTAAAYQMAAKVARDRKCEWLLLLDQDTTLPAGFLAAAAAAVQAAGPDVAALVPCVADGERIVSPARVTRLGSIKPLSPGQATSDVRAPTAVSSGSIIRVAALSRALPFPRGFWLDYVDHWMFSRLKADGGRMARVDQMLQHDLSIMAPAQLSRRRLYSILDGEAQFVRLLGPLARVFHPARLLWRFIRYCFTSPGAALGILGWLVSERHHSRC